MKNFTPPLFPRARDKRVNELIRAGQATDDELFEAQFGEWPARGINKDTNCDDVVYFKGIGEDKKRNPLSYVFNMAYARKDSETRDIYINKVLMSPGGPVLGALATRVALIRIQDFIRLSLGASAPYILPEIALLVAASSYKYAFASAFTKLFRPSTADYMGEEQIHLKQFYDGIGSVENNVFQGVAQDWLTNQPDGKRRRIETFQAIDMLLTLLPRQYYSGDAELQARLSNVIARGYPAWGKVPENKDELYAALLDMGIKAPDIVKQYYKHPEQEHLKQIFNKHVGWEQGLLAPPNAEINLGLNSYRDGTLFKTGEILEMYWEDCLPFLYADLHVKYGDSQGLKKFGYSKELDMAGMPMRLDKS